MIKSKRLSLSFVLLSLITAGTALAYVKRISPGEDSISNPIASNINNDVPPKKPEPLPIAIKSSVLLSVPFTMQAPRSNWDKFHNETCEEASSLMAYAYFNDKETLPAQYVEDELKRLADWQNNNQGYFYDQTSAEVAHMIEEVYGLQTQLKTDFTENDLKQALSEGKLVLISFAGRLLGNPFFKSPGPIHHMLVVKGYDSDGFITNDPGIGRGNGYRYTFTTFEKAAADWDHATEDMDTNQKIAIVVWK